MNEDKESHTVDLHKYFASPRSGGVRVAFEKVRIFLNFLHECYFLSCLLTIINQRHHRSFIPNQKKINLFIHFLLFPFPNFHITLQRVCGIRRC